MASRASGALAFSFGGRYRRGLLSRRLRGVLLAAAGRDFPALGPDDVTRLTVGRLARRGLLRVEWCAVLTPEGARLAAALLDATAAADEVGERYAA